MNDQREALFKMQKGVSQRLAAKVEDAKEALEQIATGRVVGGSAKDTLYMTRRIAEETLEKIG